MFTYSPYLAYFYSVKPAALRIDSLINLYNIIPNFCPDFIVCGHTHQPAIKTDRCYYVDEKTNTPLILCDSCNIQYSMLALEIIKSGENYGRYRMRISMPTYSSNYMYTAAPTASPEKRQRATTLQRFPRSFV